MESAKQILLRMMTSTEKIFESAKSEKKPILCNHGLSCMHSKSVLLFFSKKYIGKPIKYYGTNL